MAFQDLFQFDRDTVFLFVNGFSNKRLRNATNAATREVVVEVDALARQVAEVGTGARAAVAGLALVRKPGSVGSASSQVDGVGGIVHGDSGELDAGVSVVKRSRASREVLVYHL